MMRILGTYQFELAQSRRKLLLHCIQNTQGIMGIRSPMLPPIAKQKPLPDRHRFRQQNGLMLFKIRIGFRIIKKSRLAVISPHKPRTANRHFRQIGPCRCRQIQRYRTPPKGRIRSSPLQIQPSRRTIFPQHLFQRRPQTHPRPRRPWLPLRTTDNLRTDSPFMDFLKAPH